MEHNHLLLLSSHEYPFLEIKSLEREKAENHESVEPPEFKFIIIIYVNSKIAKNVHYITAK